MFEKSKRYYNTANDIDKSVILDIKTSEEQLYNVNSGTDVNGFKNS